MTQRIVIVDDVALNRRVFESLLAELSSVELLSFASSAELLKQLSSIDASLFIVDYHMPAPDGLAVLSAIRNDERVQKTPSSQRSSQSIVTLPAEIARDYLCRKHSPRVISSVAGNLTGVASL